MRWWTPHVTGVNWSNSFMEKNWGNSSIVKWKLYCDVNIFQEKALKLEILYNTLHWTFYVIISLSTRLHTFLYIHSCFYCEGNCCAEDHSMIAWFLNVAVPKSVYCIILEKNSNFILYRPNKEICLFLRNLNLNMCAIWFPV